MTETPTPDQTQTPTAPEAPAMIPLEAVLPLLRYLRWGLKKGTLADVRLALLYDHVAATCGQPSMAEAVDLAAWTTSST